jgi:hypothetical protein
MAASETHERLRLFISLSEHLTGEIGLDQAQARSHLRRLRAAFDTKLIEKLLDRWQRGAQDPAKTDRLAGQMLSDAVLGSLAQAVILIWYTGGIKITVANTTVWRIETGADYFGALAWKVVGSHAPGLSNQFFGHWKYPTEF